jgi:uncharacterized membrane protein YjfL (UPF0719 family)
MRNTSEHILNTSGNLLGFCLVIITSLHFTDKAVGSIIDECSAFVAILLAFSCFTSFISMRTTEVKNLYILRLLRIIYFLYPSQE